jgi:hypothetical protein
VGVVRTTAGERTRRKDREREKDRERLVEEGWSSPLGW